MSNTNIYIITKNDIYNNVFIENKCILQLKK